MILKALFTNSSGTLLSRILGYIRDLLTASVLGANIYSDVFFAAFKLPNLFRRIFGEGAFIQAFLPGLVATRQKSLFSTVIFIRFLGTILLFSVLVSLFNESATAFIAYGFDDATAKIAAPLVAINFWYLDLVFVVTFLGAILQYKNSFFANAYSTALLNIAMIGALVIARGLPPEEIIYYLSYGVLVGGALQILLHLYSLRQKNLTRLIICNYHALSTRTHKVANDIKSFNRQFLPSVLGSSTAQLSAFLDTLLASFLAAGAISYLYYANRIFQLPLAIFAIAAATALFPTIAKAIKNGEETRALELLKKSFWYLAIILLLATISGAMLSNEIIWLLFERGEFDREDTINTGFALSMYMIGLLPFGLAKIFNLWLYSQGKQMAAAKISAIALLFNAIFSLILVYPFGVGGLALAGSLGGVVLFILTLREFGMKSFLYIIHSKMAIWLFLSVVIEVAVILFAKQFIRVI